MITILLLQIIINLLIVSKFELICRLIKLYDLPNNKLKIHKKKNFSNRRNYCFNKFNIFEHNHYRC